jgi:hypothetical protein
MEVDLSVLFEAINAFGVVGLLAFMVMAFYRGDLIARSLLDRILGLYEEQIGELSERILERLEGIVRRD